MDDKAALAFVSTPSGAVAWNGLGEPAVMNHSAAAIAEALLCGRPMDGIVCELRDALGPHAPTNGELQTAVVSAGSLTASTAKSTAPPPRTDPAPTGPSACDAVRFQLELDAVRVLRCEPDDSRCGRRLAISLPSRDALADFDSRWGAHCESGPPSLYGAPVALGLRSLTGPGGSQVGERLLVRGGHELWRSRDPNHTRSLLHQLVETERRLIWRPGMLHAACFWRDSGTSTEVTLIPMQLLEPLASVVATLGRIGWRPAASLWPTLRGDGLVDIGEAVPARIAFVVTPCVRDDPAASAASQLIGCAWEAVHLLRADHRPKQELLEGARHTLRAVERLLADPPTVLTSDLSARILVSTLATPIC